MSNKLDPIHAVANMALALVEVQKDVAQLYRKITELTETVIKMDSALIGKFGSVDQQVAFCLATLKKETSYAANQERTENSTSDDKDLRKQEGKERVLCDDKREETQGRGKEKDDTQEKVN